MKPIPNNSVEVSIIIPSKQPDGSYQDCLESLQNQDADLNYEIILVTGGNIPQAKNRGLKNASGRLVAFIDSDCIASKNWLSSLVTQIDSLGVAGLGGPGIGLPNSGALSSAIDCVYNSFLGSLGSSSLKTPNTVMKTVSLSTHNCIYRKSVLLKIGFFDERYLMNEDTDLSSRVRAEGLDLYVSPDPIVFHKRKSNLTQFFSKFFSYGISRSRSILTNSAHLDYRVILMLCFSLVSIIFLFFGNWFSYFFLFSYLVIIVFYGVSCFFVKKIISLLFYVPILFLLEHIGYALGLIRGFLKGSYKKPETDSSTIEKHIIKESMGAF